MPPKRRKKAASKKEESSVKKTKTATKENDEKILQELHATLVECNNDVQQALTASEERGDLHKIVWPFLLNHYSSKSDAKHWKHACYLLALLTTSSCREGSFGSTTTIEFLHADETSTAVLSSVLDTLLEERDFEDTTKTTVLVHFVTVCLARDQENEILKKHVSGLHIWQSMPPRRLELELKLASGGIRRDFATLKEKQQPPVWIVSLVEYVLELVKSNNNNKNKNVLTLLYRSLELLIDLLSIRSTRRFLVAYLESIHFVLVCQPFTDELFSQLLQRLDELLQFPIQPLSNNKFMSKSERIAEFHQRATVLQKICHRYFAEKVPDVIHAGVGLICNNNPSNKSANPYLVRALHGLQDEELLNLMDKLCLLHCNHDDSNEYSRDFMLMVLTRHVTIPTYPLDILESYPLYPTESVLWDFNLVPASSLSSSRQQSNIILSLPKLNTQFLSFDDYLLRNFELIRLESAYEIRSDLVHAIQRVRPVSRQFLENDEADIAIQTVFDGWARMALELNKKLDLVKVSLPKLGQDVPSQVLADIEIDLEHCGPTIRSEWDALSEFDVLFLIGIDASQATTGMSAASLEEEDDERVIVSPEDDKNFPQANGVMAVRGCMVLHIRDEEGTILSDPAVKYENKQLQASGTKRILRVQMDPAQFAADASTGLRIYDTLNLVVRRHGRENNFKAVLETIRGLMRGSGSIQRVLPPWLQPLLLGIGDPQAASYKSETLKSFAQNTAGVTNPDADLDYGDTFLDEEHLRSSFGDDSTVVVDGRKKLGKKDGKPRCNYKVRVTEQRTKKGAPTQLVEATSYPFGAGVNGNPVRFTPVQVEAVRSGLSPGLTLVVGPPGTGKTDVAVQIIANLYHSFPSQRTIIVTHSNAALNDLFEKVIARGDVDERYLIRLGSGERELKTSSTHDFTRAGRVAQSLAKRAELLEQVQLLSESLGISGKAERGADGSPSYTCETADYFDRHHVQKRIQKFEDEIEDGETNVFPLFPFKAYFNLSEDATTEMSAEEARQKFAQLNCMFAELAEYRPLEILRTLRLRTDYLLMKQAKVVAMTCTHAAIARNHLIELGFHYDNVIMEEAGQMMEVETFIPLLLQRGESNESDPTKAPSRLKRICLIGDHQQLPPVVKNMAFSKFSNLDQSLFSRLIRLGFPYIQLNRQGRARADIAKLYSWRYKDLGNLSHVLESPSFQIANTGFAHNYQVINVDKYQGRGETTPTAYFYQNMGEAEYVVALFQFMVLIGYPPERISLLTTYNGQKDLLMDILKQRCGPGTPFAGIQPGAVSTVDRYQGQQNDFVLLSLVRTEAVGHLRDIRRLVVAVSRARLGLYVFCRQDLFANCHELKGTMEQFEQRPSKLQLVLNEHYPTERKLEDEITKTNLFEVEDVTHLGSIVHSMQEEWVVAGSKEQEQDTGE